MIYSIRLFEDKKHEKCMKQYDFLLNKLKSLNKVAKYIEVDEKSLE